MSAVSCWATSRRWTPGRAGWLRRGFGGRLPAGQGVQRQLADRGWIAPAWPTEYGGLGASITEQMVFNEEFGYHGAPDTGTRGFGVGMIGPTLIIHGNDEQKSNYLPKITSGEHIWCQGYSEPGSAPTWPACRRRPCATATTTSSTARRSGPRRPPREPDVLSGADRPRRAEAPRHLVPADRRHQEHARPLVRPLINMASRHHFNEVFFEDVRVPAAQT